MKRCSLDYFQQEDVVALSRDLLGKVLMTCQRGVVTGGIITETEAYRAPEDRASHAYNNRKTPRNTAMFQEGGIAYVYLCYGIHPLFNVVTNRQDIPHAILIRAIQPTVGVETILQRRNKTRVDRTVAGGPGTLTRALGITQKHNSISLVGDTIWIEDHETALADDHIIASPRVGIDYAGSDAELPWRFRRKGPGLGCCTS